MKILSPLPPGVSVLRFSLSILVGCWGQGGGCYSGSNKSLHLILSAETPWELADIHCSVAHVSADIDNQKE